MIASVAGRGGANERDLGSVAEFARPELQGFELACLIGMASESNLTATKAPPSISLHA